MTDSLKNLKARRATLARHFSQCSDAEGVSVNGSTDERSLDISHRLFEEYASPRSILIDFDEDGSELIDFFFKRSGVEGQEFDLLSIFVPAQVVPLSLLWDAYKLWMHEGAGEAEVDELFGRSGLSLVHRTP